ncbi:MBL fold metallo-hydrolase [Inquilinus sp.]|jgi:glyoxylase-like metal-dependent hydrolase (beta-lactamase superfamily II)|uniref:MBL fold metallo-hydrolase n=1 Tax=Inquilinus sp. TaxID=1932117 RepID=UPI003782EF0A
MAQGDTRPDRRPDWPATGAFHGFRQGDFDITVLSDGHITVPIGIVAPDGTPADRAEVLAATGDPAAGLVHYKTNIPVLRRGGEVILVDIGSGAKYQPSDGRLEQTLRAAGIVPEAVTRVVLTHGHPDHLWAMLAEDGRLRYPNATYHVGATEWDFWMDPDYRTAMPDVLHPFAEGAQRDFGAIRDRVVMLRPGDDVVTGIRVLDTAGHTPGHISLEVAGGDGLIIAGDVATSEIVSFRYPEARFGYDTLPDVAIRNRARLLARAAADRTRLLGYHWTYPGLGFAEPQGSGYRYVPG